MSEKTEAPHATMIVHWSTGPVYCCGPHADGLRKLGGVLGVHTPVEFLLPQDDGPRCSNCENLIKSGQPLPGATHE